MISLRTILSISILSYSNCYYFHHKLVYKTPCKSVKQHVNSSPKLTTILTLPITVTVSSLKILVDGIYAVSDAVITSPNTATQLIDNIENITITIRNIPSIIRETSKNFTIINKENKEEIEDIPGYLTRDEYRKVVLNNRLKSVLPQTYFNRFISAIRSCIDSIYDFQDSKLNFKAPVKSNADLKFKKVDVKRSSWYDKFEDIKENYYNTVDGISNAIDASKTAIVGAINNAKTTVKSIQNLPKTTEQVYLETQNSVERLKRNVKSFQRNAIRAGHLIWKIVSLEAAKETYEDFLSWTQQVGIKLEELRNPSFLKESKKVEKGKTDKNVIQQIQSVYNGTVQFASTINRFVRWATRKNSKVLISNELNNKMNKDKVVNVTSSISREELDKFESSVELSVKKNDEATTKISSSSSYNDIRENKDDLPSLVDDLYNYAIIDDSKRVKIDLLKNSHSTDHSNNPVEVSTPSHEVSVYSDLDSGSDASDSTSYSSGDSSSHSNDSSNDSGSYSD